MPSGGNKKWYALSSPFGREMKVVELLEEEPDIKSFVPLERYERMVGRKTQTRVVSQRPVIRNLLFIEAERNRMREVKYKYNSFIQYKMRRNGVGGYEPLTVSHKDMEAFIAITTSDEVTDLKYYKPKEIEQLGLRPEAKVRIADGIFQGKEGYYQRIKGTRSKRFVVKIENFLACSAVLAECTYIELADEAKSCHV